MIVAHVTLSTVLREPLYLDEDQLLALVRALVRVAGRRLLLFSIADDHLHAVIVAERVGYAVGGLRRAIATHAVRAIAPPHIKPVQGRPHLQRLVPYLLTQCEHHGIPQAAHLWPGSCLQDLLGARRLPSFDPTLLYRWLPRWDRAKVAEAAGCKPPEPLRDLTGQALPCLLQAARLALAAPPTGRTTAAVEARRVAAKLAVDAGYPYGPIGAALGRNPRTIPRLAAAAAAPTEHAARLRLALEAEPRRRRSPELQARRP